MLLFSVSNQNDDISTENYLLDNAALPCDLAKLRGHRSNLCLSLKDTEILNLHHALNFAIFCSLRNLHIQMKKILFAPNNLVNFAILTFTGSLMHTYGLHHHFHNVGAHLQECMHIQTVQ